MAQVTHYRRQGDGRTLLSATLMQDTAAGVSTAINVSGMIIKFVLYKAGAAVVDLTTSGVSVSDATAGEVEWDFSSSADALAAEGLHHGYFVVVESGETDYFPVRKNELAIYIESDFV